MPMKRLNTAFDCGTGTPKSDCAHGLISSVWLEIGRDWRAQSYAGVIGEMAFQGNSNTHAEAIALSSDTSS